MKYFREFWENSTKYILNGFADCDSNFTKAVIKKLKTLDFDKTSMECLDTLANSLILVAANTYVLKRSYEREGKSTLASMESMCNVIEKVTKIIDEEVGDYNKLNYDFTRKEYKDKNK